MVLSTHAVAGAAAAYLLTRNPAAAAAVGILSHLLLDMVPHWHYPLRSLEKDPRDPMRDRLVFGWNFLLDLIVIGGECLLGFMLAFLAARRGSGAVVFWGAVGGVFPDFLQLVYHKLPFFPFREIQRFHKWVHARTRLDDRHAVGVIQQVLLIIVSLVLLSS
jgi:hypothetical protein